MSPELQVLLKQAQDKFDALTPTQQEEHRRIQRDGIVKAEMSWPKSNYHYENGVKIYHSYKDYCND